MTLEEIKEFSDLKVGDYIICVIGKNYIKELGDYKDYSRYIFLEIVTELLPNDGFYRSIIFKNGTSNNGTWNFHSNVLYRIPKEDFVALMI